MAAPAELAILVAAGRARLAGVKATFFAGVDDAVLRFAELLDAASEPPLESAALSAAPSLARVRLRVVGADTATPDDSAAAESPSPSPPWLSSSAFPEEGDATLACLALGAVVAAASAADRLGLGSCGDMDSSPKDDDGG